MDPEKVPEGIFAWILYDKQGKSWPEKGTKGIFTQKHRVRGSMVCLWYCHTSSGMGVGRVCMREGWCLTPFGYYNKIKCQRVGSLYTTEIYSLGSGS